MQIIQDFIPIGRNNRPGYTLIPEGECIHETGSFSVGANARSHAVYIKSDSCANRPASWHFTVGSDPIIYQHLPVYPNGENGWHAGDGHGRGNRKYIGIEMCVNIDGDYEQTLRNTIWLCRHLIETVPSLKSRITSATLLQQHFHFSGKNCPQRLRAEGRWNWFVNQILNNNGGDVMFDEGVKVKIKQVATTYMTGQTIPATSKGKEYTIKQLGHPWNVVGDGALIEEIASWVWAKDLELANLPVVVCGNCSVQEEKIKTLEAQIKTLNTSNKNITDTLTQRTNEATKLQNDVKELNAKVLNLTKTLTEVKEVNSMYANNNEYLEKKIAERELVIDDYRERFDELEAISKKQAEDFKELSLKYGDLQNDIEVRLNKITADYEEKLNAEKSINSDLKEQVENLRKELKPVSTTIDWQDASAMDLIIRAIKKMFGKE
jgi:hypothetical protein